MRDSLHFLDRGSYIIYPKHLAFGIGHLPTLVLVELFALTRMSNCVVEDTRKDGLFIRFEEDFILINTGITKKEIKFAIERLMNIGIVVFRVFGVPAVRHFQINEYIVNEIFEFMTKPKNCQEYSYSIQKLLDKAQDVQEAEPDEEIELNIEPPKPTKPMKSTNKLSKNPVKFDYHRLTRDNWFGEHKDKHVRVCPLEECPDVLLSEIEYASLCLKYGVVDVNEGIKFLNKQKQYMTIDELNAWETDFENLWRWALEDMKSGNPLGPLMMMKSRKRLTKSLSKIKESV